MNIQKSNDGVVLPIVLIFLVAAIVMAVTVLYSSKTDVRIAGSRKRALQEFYIVESAVSLTINATTSWIGDPPAEFEPEPVNDVVPEVEVVLHDINRPPMESGCGVKFLNAYYYDINPSVNNQNIVVGAWKVFPK